MEPLAVLVARLRYKPGWRFRIGGPLNGKLCIFAETPDSHLPQRDRITQHQFDLPDVSNERDFYRWVFDHAIDAAEFHERGEFFAVDGFRPFYPNHQDEGSPYELVERWET